MVGTKDRHRPRGEERQLARRGTREEGERRKRGGGGEEGADRVQTESRNSRELLQYTLDSLHQTKTAPQIQRREGILPTCFKPAVSPLLLLLLHIHASMRRQGPRHRPAAAQAKQPPLRNPPFPAPFHPSTNARDNQPCRSTSCMSPLWSCATSCTPEAALPAPPSPPCEAAAGSFLPAVLHPCNQPPSSSSPAASSSCFSSSLPIPLPLPFTPPPPLPPLTIPQPDTSPRYPVPAPLLAPYLSPAMAAAVSSSPPRTPRCPFAVGFSSAKQALQSSAPSTALPDCDCEQAVFKGRAFE